MTSVRWWFENRETGEITIAQFPNWPLFGVGLAWATRRIADDGSPWHDIAGVAVPVLWCYWGADEVVRGVNPWRRLLGAGVIVWQLAALVR